MYRITMGLNLLCVCCARFRAKVEERVKQLTDVLVFELSPDRSLRGGPRATRRAVCQLIRLGQSTKVSAIMSRSSLALFHAMRQSHSQMECHTEQCTSLCRGMVTVDFSATSKVARIFSYILTRGYAFHIYTLQRVFFHV